VATSGGEEVKIWDLRKLAKSASAPPVKIFEGGGEVVAFDASASYLAIGGNGVK
jgi:hypothetical protein